jgi:hypothetical protein
MGVRGAVSPGWIRRASAKASEARPEFCAAFGHRGDGFFEQADVL